VISVWKRHREPYTNPRRLYSLVRAAESRGRFDWNGRDPEWKDVEGLRGRQDVEMPTGEWNRSEVICDYDSITNVLNGKVMNRGTSSTHTFGQIQLQSESAEIWIRRVEIRPVER
jgi:hypothetical protein